MWTLRPKNEPDRWYYSNPGDYEAISHFVRDYPELFDEYAAVESVALIFNNNEARHAVGKHRGLGRNAPDTQLRDASIALALANVPHRFIVAGDEWVEDQLLGEDLSTYDAVVRFEPSYLSAEQEEALKQAGDRLVTWAGIDDLLAQLTPQISIEGTDQIVAVPRQRLDTPAVCHLLNQNYQPGSDTYLPERDFTVSLAKSIYSKTFSAATLYAPGAEPLTLDCQVQEDVTVIAVPELDMWGVLKLE